MKSISTFRKITEYGIDCEHQSVKVEVVPTVAKRLPIQSIPTNAKEIIVRLGNIRRGIIYVLVGAFAPTLPLA